MNGEIKYCGYKGRDGNEFWLEGEVSVENIIEEVLISFCGDM